MSVRWLLGAAIACIIDVAATGAVAGGKPAAAPPAPQTETTRSLIVTTVAVPEGTLRVRLPADIAAGDTISGTVVAEPAGTTDAERSANASALNGYVVDAGSSKTGVARRVITFVLPATATVAALVIHRGNGQIAGRANVPVRAQTKPFGRPPVASDFHFPQVSAAGQPFAIGGPFDGDLAHSALTVGGQPAELIAASPRTLVAAPAANVSGPTTYQLNQNGVAVSAPCNVVSLSLSASKTSLLKGEHVPVHIVIGGLAGIRQPVRVRLVNATPDVVVLGGGQTQVLAIAPSDLAANGTYATDRDVTGLRAGGFSLYATLDDTNPPLLADGAPASPPPQGPRPAGTPGAATGTTTGTAPDQPGRTVSRDKPTPTPKPTATPTAAPTPTASPPACKWKVASITTTPYGVDTKDDKKLKALQTAASTLVSKAAPAAANVVAALPAVFGQVSKNLVEVYITYICVDPSGAVLATKVVHLTDIEALDWSAPDAQSFNSGDRKAERQKDILRNTPNPH